MSRLFEQAGSMNFQCAATNGGLTGEFPLNFRPDVNGDCHGPPPKLYGTAALRSSQTWAIPQPLRPPWVAVTHGPVYDVTRDGELSAGAMQAKLGIETRGADRATANCSIIDSLKCGSARCSCCSFSASAHGVYCARSGRKRTEERRVGKECRSRW